MLYWKYYQKTYPKASNKKTFWVLRILKILKLSGIKVCVGTTSTCLSDETVLDFLTNNVQPRFRSDYSSFAKPFSREHKIAIGENKL